MSTLGRLVCATDLPFVGGVLAWSPTGDWLAAGAYLGQLTEEPSPVGGLASVDAGSGDVRWRIDELRTSRLVVSADGRLLALSSDWGEFFGPHTKHVRVVDPATGAVLWTKADAQAIGPAGFSPHGRLLAVELPGADGIAAGAVLDAATGQVRRDLGPRRLALAFSSDSKWLTVRDQGALMVLDPGSGTNRWPAGVPCDEQDVVFTEGDTRVVASEREVLLVSPEDGAVVARNVLEGGWQTRAIFLRLASTSFGPDGNLLVRSGFLDGRDRIGVFGTADGRLRWERGAVNGTGTAGAHVYPKVAFGPDGRVVAANMAIAEDRWVPGVSILDAATGATLWQDTTVAVRRIAFSPDGGRLAVSGRTAAGKGFVRVYQAAAEPVRCELEPPVERVAVTTTGIRLAAAAHDRRKVSICDADSGRRLLVRETPGNLTAVAFTPDGQHFVTGATDQVRMYQTVSGGLVWRSPDGGAVNALAVSADGQWVAAARGDKTARVHSAAGAPRWVRPHPHTVSHIAFSGDGTWVATGCADRSTRVLDATTGEPAHRFEHDGAVEELVFAGTRLAVGARDATALVVDATGGKQLLLAPHPEAVAAVALSPGGALLATGSGALLRVYAVDGTGLPLLERRLPSRITALRFHPTDRRVAVVTEDSIVRVLDSGDAVERFRLLHPLPVRDIAISAAGDLIATACGDDLARTFAGR